MQRFLKSIGTAFDVLIDGRRGADIGGVRVYELIIGVDNGFPLSDAQAPETERRRRQPERQGAISPHKRFLGQRTHIQDPWLAHVRPG
jgi:hypothetical protein